MWWISRKDGRVARPAAATGAAGRGTVAGIGLDIGGLVPG
jgi:hypothetical protein